MHSVLLPSFELPEDRGGIGKVIGALARAYQHMLCVERVPRAFSYTWLVRLFLRYQPREIWTHHVLPIGTMACVWNILTRTPYVVFLHGQDFDLTKASWRKRCVTKVILRRARLVVANSQALAREIAAYYHLSQVDVLYPTVDPLYLASVPDKVRTNRLRLLTVCRLVSRKGILRVLDALRDLPDVDYTIIGRGVQEHEINAYICKHQLESRVTLRTDIDTTEELRDAYDHADVFVMPTQITSTDREGFGIVYLEAAARGLPVIASNLAGVDEAVVGGETGILISDGSREQLVQSIRALQESPDRARALGDNGRSRMLAFFSPERFVAQAKAILTPKISVIIPTYNHAEALPSCLDAIFRQYYQYLEVIIVNDGSTDNTADVIADFFGTRETTFVYRGISITIVHQANGGAQRARNRGFLEATGEYVIFCDADVVMRPTMLLLMMQELLKHPESAFAYSRFTFGWKLFRSQAFQIDDLRRINYIHTTSLCRKKDFPGFDEHLKRFHDWDVWLTLAARGKNGVFLKKNLFHVIVHGPSRIGSAWLPRVAYRIPWKKLGFVPKRIQSYERAREAICEKHHSA